MEQNNTDTSKKDFKQVVGKVIKIKPTFILAQFDTNKVGICHITNSSVDWVDDINKIFKLGETYTFYLIESKDNGDYGLSLRDPNLSRNTRNK